MSNLEKVIGRWEWQRPTWVSVAGERLTEGWRFLAADVKRLIALILVLYGAIAGWLWYRSRPVAFGRAWSPIQQCSARG